MKSNFELGVSLLHQERRSYNTWKSVERALIAGSIAVVATAVVLGLVGMPMLPVIAVAALQFIMYVAARRKAEAVRTKFNARMRAIANYGKGPWD